MGTLSDQRLAAYHDGELSAEETRAVSAVLAHDPEARERLRLLAENDAVVRRAMSAPVHEAVPDHLLQAIEEAAVSSRPATVVPMRRRSIGRMQRWALPLAASVALIVGVAGGYGVSWLIPPRDVANVPDATSTFVAAFDRRIERALETTASGEPVTWRLPDRPGELRIRPVLSFVDGSGRFCREYEASQPGPAGEVDTVGIACRGEGGQWRVELAAAAKAQASGAFHPASGSAGAALGAAIDTLMVDGPLNAERERELIARGWQDR